MLDSQFQQLRAEAIQTNTFLGLILEHLRMADARGQQISPEAFKESKIETTIFPNPLRILSLDLAELKKEAEDVRGYATAYRIQQHLIRLIEIVEQLEKRPQTQFSTLPPVGYPPTVPMIVPPNPWPPYLPYVGDPPGGFGGTTCLGMPVQSTLTSKCSTESPHAAHTFGGRPTQLCGGETDPDIRNAQNRASSPDATGTSAPDEDIPF